MKNFFIFLIIALCLSNISYAVNSTTDNIIENSFLNTNTLNLVNVDIPDDTTALLPKIYFLSMREGFIFIAGAALIVSIAGIITVFIIVLIVRDVIVSIGKH